MSVPYILFMVVSAVTLLLLLVLKLKINAFISLLLTSVYVGILAGMDLGAILKSIQDGMGSTLGFVATVVGLGAIFGQMLESSGGAESLARTLIRRFGQGKASWAMVITGFIVAIPVFLDVGFIILVPIVYALSRDTRRSLLYYAIPLLAGLAVTHAFVPPTPGPVAVADIIKVQLGWVILFGFILGIPTAIVAGPLWGRIISKKIFVQPPSGFSGLPENKEGPDNLPSFGLIASLIGIPLVLILFNTMTGVLVDKDVIEKSLFTDIVEFIGHPFSALIIATLMSIWLLCIRRGMPRQSILELSNKALGPAGIIILITGAGGVLKQILVDSGIGKMMAESMAGSAISPVLLAWILAALVRLTQGSATVAMITAAGIISPVVSALSLSEPQLAILVIAIASGATIASHVNDSGFWLVGKYLGMSEKQTLQSWTVMETIIAICGLVLTLAIWQFIS
jgi:Gnt-I system low-affinity gluconate transporter